MVSGMFENITREKLEAFIKKNGGKLQGAVNAATNYMLVGKLLDDGRPVCEGKKYQRALELGIKIIQEKEFEMLCKQKFDNPDFLLGRKRAKDTTDGAFEYFAGEDKEKGSDEETIDKIDDITDLLTDMSEGKPILPMKRPREQQMTSKQPNSPMSNTSKPV